MKTVQCMCDDDDCPCYKTCDRFAISESMIELRYITSPREFNDDEGYCKKYIKKKGS